MRIETDRHLVEELLSHLPDEESQTASVQPTPRFSLNTSSPTR
ncbi:MAG: hypothetical protein R3D02_08930 [Hyphomicrobiales bacterium]